MPFNDTIPVVAQRSMATTYIKVLKRKPALHILFIISLDRNNPWNIFI